MMNRQIIKKYSPKQSEKFKNSPKMINRRQSLQVTSSSKKSEKLQSRSTSFREPNKRKTYFTRIRKHDSLPLVHDGTNLYGQVPKKFNDYEYARYPWKNSRIKEKDLKKSWKLLGPLPYIEKDDIEEGSMNVFTDENFTRGFMLYVTEPYREPKNIRQLKKDTDDPGRNKYLRSHTFALLGKIFVDDKTWNLRYPLYSQGMDRTVNDWGIQGNVSQTIHDLRLIFLAIEYVCKDWKIGEKSIKLHSLEFLGRITPFENIPPSYSDSILPLYEYMKDVVRNMRPDSAYFIATKVKRFYEDQYLKKKNNTFENMKKFLKKCGYIDETKEKIYLVAEQPDLLVTYRGNN